MILAMLLLIGHGSIAASMAEPAGTPPPASDLPLDRDGMPTRPLNDEELHSLLLTLSARNDTAALLLARCHAAGSPYRTPGWRSCIEGRR